LKLRLKRKIQSTFDLMQRTIISTKMENRDFEQKLLYRF
jgi:hypothetical protein